MTSSEMPSGPSQDGDAKLLEISLEVDGEAAEAVSAVFNQHGLGGSVLEELRPEDACAPPTVRAKTYVRSADRARLERIETALWHLGQIYPIPSPTMRSLSNADWQDSWKAGYKPRRIGRRILIAPAWQPCPAIPSRIFIELDPGLAFGTGLHPSTHLCLLALEQHLRAGQRVLDVGTGSGILAIAAAKLGAGAVVAIDIDSLALDVARDNVARNAVQAVVTLARASLTQTEAANGVPLGDDPVPIFGGNGTFDWVLMNILPEVIAVSAPAVAACLAPGGQFMVSGIIETREGFVREALAAAGLTVRQRLRRSDWIALVGASRASEIVGKEAGRARPR